MLDVAAVRSQFPALASRAAFSTARGARRSRRRDRRDDRRTCANRTRTWAARSHLARRGEVMERGHAAAADFTGGEPEGIAFGANMTTLNFQLAHAVARTLGPGDEIVVTALDHDANVSPWLLVAADHDLIVRIAPMRPDDVTLDVDALEGLIGERTRVVAFTLASNAVGSIPDAGRIAAAAHARRRTRLGRRRPPRPARAAARPRARPRRRALLALQVLRPAPGHRARSGPSSRRRCRPTASGRPRRTRPAIASRRARSRTRRSRAPGGHRLPARARRRRPRRRVRA